LQLYINRWICYAVSYVFIVSGVTKLIISDFRRIFINLGIPYPEFTLYFIAIIEITCGTLIATRMHIKYATPPLILIMLGAIFITKIPLLSTSGFLTFAFEARLDFVMLILLLLIWKYMR